MGLTKEEDYRIEERDDPRTLTGELTSDSEQAEQEEEKQEENRAKNGFYLSAYYGTFDSLLRELGEVAYYFKMLQNLKKDNEKAQAVAKRYNHDADYYLNSYRSHRDSALFFAGQYATCAESLGVAIWSNRDEKNIILNDLVFDKDKRTSIRGIAKRAENRGQILSIYEMFDRRKKSPSN